MSIQKIKNFLLSNFIGRSEEINAILLSLISKQHCLLIGPPGTGKSLIIQTLSHCLDTSYFSYLMTKFTTPDEIFGAVNIKELKENGIITYNTTNKFPEAKIVFLDEIFKSSSAILNSLLTAINERTFVNGNQVIKLPLWSLFGASNEIPSDDSLNALYDRFMFRCWSDYITPDLWGNYLDKYIELHNTSLKYPKLNFDYIEKLYQKFSEIDLEPIKDVFLSTIHKIADNGITVSDRRFGRAYRSISAMAVMNERDEVVKSDISILKYIIPEKQDDVNIINQIIVDLIGNEKKTKQELEELLPQVIALENISFDELIDNIENLKTIRNKVDRVYNKYKDNTEIVEMCNKIYKVFDKINKKMVI